MIDNIVYNLNLERIYRPLRLSVDNLEKSKRWLKLEAEAVMMKTFLKRMKISK